MIEGRAWFGPATEAIVALLRQVPDDRLDAPAPCSDWDVRTTVNHVIFWNGRAATAAAKRKPVGPEEDHDFTAEPGWADRFAEQAAATARAWDDADAWTGNTSLSGAEPGMPAPTIGSMVIGECVVHGWDIATALGLEPDFDPGLVQYAYDGLVGIADMGRKHGAFGPEVAVPEDAPLLDRLIGMSGRDPNWKP
ncbi:TIGR03086 family metal-binding protein [Actinomadura harenae]|uniref:TIGR03086 family protein n=1 Tax=Actinomadura harenae TaxID=2483351 RepID=A0A3M2LTL2_9ACTN|nr:TIGR03086 family metal-binding protein [Actinomadura harenae]RMI39385.1 TIGR03086 family protein [Actinomadura harenae]